MELPKVNKELIKLARARLAKKAFVPSDAAAGGVGDSAAGGAPPGGAPPMDPSMMGGAPPGGPPMDPSMMGAPPGGAPPMDPSMMGGMPPMDPSMMGGGLPPDLDSKIQDAVQKALQSGGNGGPGSPKQPKPDINTIATDLFQLKKMFLAYLRRQGIELPPDILDGPNRDPATGAPAISPSGGSDVAPGSSQATAKGAIKPIAPIQPAVMNAISGIKQSSSIIAPSELIKEAGDVLRLYAITIQNGLLKQASVLYEDTSAQPDTLYNDAVEVGNPIATKHEPSQASNARHKAAALVRMFAARR